MLNQIPNTQQHWPQPNKVNPENNKKSILHRMIKNPIIITYHESIPWKSGEQSLEELRGSELFNHPWIDVTVYYGEIKIKYNHNIIVLHASHSLA